MTLRGFLYCFSFFLFFITTSASSHFSGSQIVRPTIIKTEETLSTSYFDFTALASDFEVNKFCLPENCHSTWHYLDKNITYYCNVASGPIPLNGLKLPLIFEGNYELCKTFEEAHFCRVELPMIFAPVDQTFSDTRKYHLNRSYLIPIGSFRYESCLNLNCASSDLMPLLLNSVVALLKDTASALPLPHNSTEAINAFIADFIKTNLKVTCFDEESEDLDSVAWLFSLLMTLWLALVLLSTLVNALTTLQHLKPWLKVFDLKSSLNKFSFVRENKDLAALNGIRFFSMCWIILCHNFVLFTMREKDTTAIDSITQSFPIVFIRGGFFAVDSFFLLSGLLAANKLYFFLKDKRLTPSLFFKIALQRYLRIAPLYLGSVLFFWKIMPYLSFFSDLYIDYVRKTECEKLFFPFNLLLINNFITSTGCAVWTWYLACDFQFFLLAPFLINFFIYYEESKPKSSMIFRISPLILLLVVQLLSTFFIIRESPFLLTSARFVQTSQNYYYRPYTRITPYLTGIFLFFCLHEAKKRILEERKTFLQEPLLSEEETATSDYAMIKLGRKKRILVNGLALAGMLSMVSVFFVQFRCKHGRSCSVFYAQSLFGYVGENNLTPLETEILYSSCFLLWSGFLALFVFTQITHPENDLFRLRPFLSLKSFALLSKLTFIAYLLHLPLIRLVIGPQKLQSFKLFPFLLSSLGMIGTTYLSAFPLYLVFEAPFANLFNKLMR